MITDQFGMYVGGGIGAGGYRFGEVCCGELQYLDPKAASLALMLARHQRGGNLTVVEPDRLLRASGSPRVLAEICGLSAQNVGLVAW